MTRWSYRCNVPGWDRYEPPTAHIPTPPTAADSADGDTPAVPPGRVPANRSTRFPDHTAPERQP